MVFNFSVVKCWFSICHLVQERADEKEEVNQVQLNMEYEQNSTISSKLSDSDLPSNRHVSWSLEVDVCSTVEVPSKYPHEKQNKNILVRCLHIVCAHFCVQQDADLPYIST